MFKEKEMFIKDFLPGVTQPNDTQLIRWKILFKQYLELIYSNTFLHCN
jgi:hypothetical protein